MLVSASFRTTRSVELRRPGSRQGDARGSQCTGSQTICAGLAPRGAGVEDGKGEEGDGAEAEASLLNDGRQAQQSSREARWSDEHSPPRSFVAPDFRSNADSSQVGAGLGSMGQRLRLRVDRP